MLKWVGLGDGINFSPLERRLVADLVSGVSDKLMTLLSISWL